MMQRLWTELTVNQAVLIHQTLPSILLSWRIDGKVFNKRKKMAQTEEL